MNGEREGNAQQGKVNDQFHGEVRQCCRHPDPEASRDLRRAVFGSIGCFSVLSRPPSSATASQPAPPSGMVKARRPRNGFSAATTEEVSSVAVPAMSATRFAKEVNVHEIVYPPGPSGHQARCRRPAPPPRILAARGDEAHFKPSRMSCGPSSTVFHPRCFGDCSIQCKAARDKRHRADLQLGVAR